MKENAKYRINLHFIISSILFENFFNDEIRIFMLDLF